MSLQQIAAATKISVRALQALERNDISRLPGGIFCRSFVRSYAQEVGLDPERTVREFLEHCQSESAADGLAGRAEVHRELELAIASQQRAARTMLRLVLVSVPLIVVLLYLTLNGWTERAEVPASAAAPAESVLDSGFDAAPAERPPHGSSPP